LRSALPSLRIRVHCSGLKNILNKARQTGATKVALLKRAADGQLVATLWHAEEVVRDLSIVELTSNLQE